MPDRRQPRGKPANAPRPGPPGNRKVGGREPPGYAVRALAVRLISAVLDRGRALDDALAQAFSTAPGKDLETRDKGLARLIATTVLRRKGELEVVLDTFLERPLPADRGLLSHILLASAAQLVVLDTPPHAVINIAVEQCRHDRGARRFDRLANAVLRRISERGRELLAEAGGARRNIPDWLWAKWVAAYGAEQAAAIAAASLQEAALDLSVASDPEGWTQRLGGVLLATGSIRLGEHGRIEELPGYDQGQWWVQDAAAAIPARLFGDVTGKTIVDLCAAPGGKTAQLASAGAHVTALDVDAGRLERVRENLRRLQLDAAVVAADVLTWSATEAFDGVLLDAPCTATGTIRRHPDILHLKRSADIERTVRLQSALLDKAAAVMKPGGLLVYCTCSLLPEEGEAQIEGLLSRNPALQRLPVEAGDVGGIGEFLTPRGDVRTFPFHSLGTGAEASGIDGFYVARLRRIA